MVRRIKQIREHFGLTQEQFAKKINRTTGFISNVETGRCGISLETIKTICTVFDINEEWISNGTGKMFLPGKEKSKS